MIKLLALTGSLLMAAAVSASAADTPATGTPPAATHSADSMVTGSHAMAGQKQHHMSDRVMPSQSRHCTDEELAKMPADHKAACGK